MGRSGKHAKARCTHSTENARSVDRSCRRIRPRPATARRSGSVRFVDGRLDRLRCVGADADAFGAHELDVGDADEAEDVPQISFLEIEVRAAAFGAVETAACRRDDDLASAREAFGAVRAVAERLAGDHDAVDPRLQLARDAEVVHRRADHDDVGGQKFVEHAPSPARHASAASATGSQCGSGLGGKVAVGRLRVRVRGASRPRRWPR